MSDKGQKVAIITGGSQGIGASLVTDALAFRLRPDVAAVLTAG